MKKIFIFNSLIYKFEGQNMFENLLEGRIRHMVMLVKHWLIIIFTRGFIKYVKFYIIIKLKKENLWYD